MPKSLGGDTFDEPLLPDPTGLVSFSLQPRSTTECIERLDGSKLHATANGVPMKLESAGGSHVEHPMGPGHFPVAQTICDPVRFTIRREAVPHAGGATVAIEVTDGATTLRFAFEAPFDARRLSLVAHAPVISPGDHLRLHWSPDGDDLVAADKVRACLEPPPGAACPKSLNGSQCTDARLTGHDVELDVPAGWTCASSGNLWVQGVSPSAKASACDAHVTKCRADLQPSAEHVPVTIAPAADTSDGSFACGSKVCSRGQFCTLTRSLSPANERASCAALSTKCQAADDPCDCARRNDGFSLDCASGHPVRRLTIPTDP